MSNIDKRATELRERFEAWWEVNYHNGNPPRFGWAAWRDGDGYKIDDDESELDGMWQAWQAAHSGKMEDAEKRNEHALSLLISANTENVWEIIGRLNVVISGDYRSEAEIAAAAGKGE